MGQGNFQTPNSHVDGKDSAKTMVYNTKRNSKREARKEKKQEKERKVKEIQQ